jgi:hypothetical protein
MEKRKQKRVRARVLVKIDGKSGILNDYSDSGLQISTNTVPARKRVDILFTFNGQEVSMKGVIQWIKKRYSLQNTFQIGCALENPPEEYLHFLDRG